MSSSFHIFAHRGANRVAHENSYAAFEASMALGVDGMECDIQLSKDGVPVLWHDADLKFVGMPDMRIDLLDWADLMTFDVLYQAKHDSFDGILTLDKYLDSYLGRTQLLLEIKKIEGESIEHRKRKVEITIEMLQKKAPPHCPFRNFISSFDHEIIDYAYSLNKNFSYIANSNDFTTGQEIKDHYQKYPYIKGFCLKKVNINKDIVTAIKDLNLIPIAFTCNDRKEVEKLTDWGVEIIISDCPKELE